MKMKVVLAKTSLIYHNYINDNIQKAIIER